MNAAEIWIRQKGTRRQAFYRAAGAVLWQPIFVTTADKALRDGTFTAGGVCFTEVVPRETTDEPEHPAKAAFRQQAEFLRLQMDAINGRRQPAQGRAA